MIAEQLYLLLLSLAAGALLGISFCLYEGLVRRRHWPQDLLWWWLTALPLLLLWLWLWRGSFRGQIYLWLLLGFALAVSRFYAPLTAWVRRFSARLRRPKWQRGRKIFNKAVEKSCKTADFAAVKVLSSTCRFRPLLKQYVAGFFKKNKDKKI